MRLKMKSKKYLIIWIIILILISNSLLIATPTTIIDAENAANFHLLVKERSEDFSIHDMFIFNNAEGDTLSYIANLSPFGFIAISTDTDITPIIAYSFKGNFPYDEDENNILYHMLKYDMKLRLEAIADTTYPKILSNNQLWSVYLSEDLSYLERDFQQWPPEGSTLTGGWVETTWKQGIPYNNFCPLDPLPSPSGRSLVGCVATAMAQIINYHKYIGYAYFNDSDDYHSNWNGFDFYIDDDYNDYDFPSFEELNLYLDTLNNHYTNNDTLTSNDIAALNFACGISIFMQYSSNSSGIGSYWFDYLATALLDKFGYTSAEYISGDDSLFYDTLAQNMKNAQPAELVISRGHAIVCDGYNTDDEYHLNFGYGPTSPDSILEAWYELPDSLPAGYGDVVMGILEIKDLHGTITGNITLEYQPYVNITDVEVKADTIVVHPYENGDYKIHLQPGVYDVTASLYGYEPVTIENVPVYEDSITDDINFYLNIHIPNTIIVDINGTGNYTKIQDAIDDPNVIDSDVILVYPGTYKENINFKGKRITVASLFLSTNDTSYIYSTIIDGDNNGSVATFENEEDRRAILCGFTITNGLAYYGGGIKCSYTSPTLDNLIITGNTADYGGGVYIYDYSFPSLSNITININTANCGAGIYCDYYTKPHLSNVTIKGNNAISGAGIYCKNNSTLDFGSTDGCNIFLNFADLGNDLYAFYNCPNINIFVDTFTVFNPDDHFAYPIDNFTFDILNAKVEQVNADLYVSPTGSNDNSGLTNDEPLKTISYALVKIIPDITNPNTIHLTNGIYSPSQNGEIFPLYCRSYISLQGTDADSTIIDGEELSGILYCRNDNDFSIQDMTIQNGSATYGAGIYLSSSSPSLTNLFISGNNANYGAAIYCSGSSTSLNNLTISENTAMNSGGAVYCTPYDPPGCDLDIINSIIWNNTPQEISAQTIEITATYSDIQDGTGQPWFGEGCIDIGPLFVDANNDDYSLSQISPCINAGNPDPQYNDPDGTRADMGAFSATFETYTFVTGCDNWVSFPILNPNKVDAYDFFEPLIQNGSLRMVAYGDDKLHYDQSQGIWINDIGDLRTVYGYKVEMFEPDFISLYGYKVPPDTTIYLYAEVDKAPWPPPLGDGNWIGYFIPGSQLWQIAFAHILDKITFIKADDWSYINGYCMPSSCTVDYGKLYIVGVSEDCSFTWQGIGYQPADPYKKQQTEVFSYEETFDYMPIFVDSTEAAAGIDEIGVFVDNECLGASKIEGFPVFIPAYIDEDSTGSKDYNELTFQIATYGKGGKRSIPAFVYNEMKDAFVQEPVILDKDSYAIVRLGTGEGMEFPEEFTLYQNYPNPITNSTTISFVPSPGVEKSEIKIYNIKGQLIKKYDVQNAKSGINKLVWNGRNDNGKKLGNGIYFYKLISGDKSEIKKMLLLS